MKWTRTCLFLWILLPIQNMGGQSFLNIVYQHERSLTILGIDFMDDDLIMHGLIFPPESDYWKGFAARLDTLGNIENWIEFGDSSSHITNVLGSLKFTIDCDQNIVIPFSKSGLPRAGLVSISRTFELNFIRQYAFLGHNVIVPYCVVSTPDSAYMICGWAQEEQNPFDIQSFVLRTDENGVLTWHEYYGNAGSREAAFTMVTVNPNEYLIGGISDANSFIITIDSLGNQMRFWVNTDTLDTVARGLHIEPNGDYVYVSSNERPTTYPHLQYEVSVPIFIRRDSNFVLKTYNELTPYTTRHLLFNMIQSRDGGWIAVGSRTNRTDEGLSPPASIYGRVVKLDSDGNLIWEVQDTGYFDPDLEFSENVLVNVVESSTGSIYAVGNDHHRNPNGDWREYGWLLKITADGCTDTICTTTSLYDQIYGKEHSVQVYPNPASEYVIVNVDEGMDDCRASVFDINGRLVLSRGVYPGENIIALPDGLPSGIYIWRVTEVDGTVVGVGKVVVER